MRTEAAPKIDHLCIELRRIVDAELSAGNSVSEAWSGWGTVVLLVKPFLLTHIVEDLGKILFKDIDDPHYWKSEYHCHEHDQTVACGF